MICFRIANETTIHQIWGDVDVNNYKQLGGLQQWENLYHTVDYSRPRHEKYESI